MKIEKASKVFNCCGQYYAVTAKAKDIKVKCPRCGRNLVAPVQVPKISIVDTK